MLQEPTLQKMEGDERPFGLPRPKPGRPKKPGQEHRFKAGTFFLSRTKRTKQKITFKLHRQQQKKKSIEPARSNREECFRHCRRSVPKQPENINPFFPSRWARGRRLERRSNIGEATAAARRVPPHVRQSPPRFLQSSTGRAAGRPHTTALPGGSSRAGVVDTLFPVPPSEQHARRRDAEVCHRTAQPGRQPLAWAARPSLAVGQGIG